MYEHKVICRLKNPFHKASAGAKSFLSLTKLLDIQLVTSGDHAWKTLGGYEFKSTRHWILNINFGRGAGYVLGRRLYIAHNAKSSDNARYENHKHLVIGHNINTGRNFLNVGFTQIASVCPYGDG